MSKFKTTAVLTVGLIAGFFLSSGSTTYNLDYDYRTGAGAYTEHFPFEPYREVNYTGDVTVGGYTVHFRTEEQDENLNGSTIGYTYPGGDKEIWVETGYRAEVIESTCDHEVFHEMFPSFSHPSGSAKYSDPIYRYSDDARIIACDTAVMLALEKQNN